MTTSRVAGRLLGDGHRLLNADVQEPSGDALDDGRIPRWVVSQHEERSSERAAIEPWLQAILYVLRSAADEERAGGADDCIDRLTRSGVQPEYPAHVPVRSCDKAVEAHHRVPEQLAHPGLRSIRIPGLVTEIESRTHRPRIAKQQ